MSFTMKFTAPGFATIATIACSLFWFSCSNKNPDEIEQRIEVVQNALQHHAIDSLQPYLAPGYTVKGLPEGLEPIVLPTIFEKLPAPQRYKITQSASEKRGTRLNVTFYFKNADSLKTNFLIAADGKFLELNLLEDAVVKSSEE